MSKFKKIFLGLLVVMILFGLAACNGDEDTGSSDSEGTDSDSSEGLSGEVTMWTASLSGEPFDSYFAEIEAAFEEMHPNVDVIIEDIPQNEIEQKVLTSLTGDDVPDLVNLAPRYMVNIAAQGGLLDLED